VSKSFKTLRLLLHINNITTQIQLDSFSKILTSNAYKNSFANVSLILENSKVMPYNKTCIIFSSSKENILNRHLFKILKHKNIQIVIKSMH